MTATRYAVYGRISADKAMDAKGVRRQVKDARALVASRGGVVVAECVDNDISATSGKRRPEYERLLALVDAGQVDAIVVYQSSRLWRNRRERADGIERLRRAGVSVYATAGPDLDMSSAGGRAIAGLLGEFDTYESDVKGERIARKHQELAEQGKIASGGRAFGYRRLFDGGRVVRDEIDESEAEVVRSLAKRFISGESGWALAAELNRGGVPTVTGKPWKSTTIRRLLGSAKIAGLREHRGKTYPATMWEPIITGEEHHLLRARLAATADPSISNVRKWWLSGHVYCVCGSRMGSGTTRTGVPRYACLITAHGGCGKVAVVMAPVEEMVGRYLVGRLDDPRFAAELARRGRQDDGEALKLRTLIEGDQARLSALSDALGGESVAVGDIPGLVSAAASIRDRITARQAELHRLADVPAAVSEHVGIDLETFVALPMQTKRVLLAWLVERVVIGPAKGRGRFDPSRVSIESR